MWRSGSDAGHALLERLERGLAHVEAAPAEMFAQAMPWSLRPEHAATVVRMGPRSLIVADVNRSVTAGTSLPAALTERLAAEVPRLEQTVGTYHALLTQMPGCGPPPDRSPGARRARHRDGHRRAARSPSTPPPPSGYGGAMIRPVATEDATIPEPTTGRWNARWGRPGEEEIEIGNILMPFGLITCTVLTWVGMGILLSGISQNNDWDGRPDPTE